MLKKTEILLLGLCLVIFAIIVFPIFSKHHAKEAYQPEVLTPATPASTKSESIPFVKGFDFKNVDFKVTLGKPIIIPPLWEKLQSDVSGSTSRMEVPGGWLVKTVVNGVGISTVYVPDSKHEWEMKYKQEIHLQ